MIIYQDSNAAFIRDCQERDIEELLEAALLAHARRRVSPIRRRTRGASSWIHVPSIQFGFHPGRLLGGPEVFGIPETSNRIDVLLTGYSENNSPKVVISSSSSGRRPEPQRKTAS